VIVNASGSGPSDEERQAGADHRDDEATQEQLPLEARVLLDLVENDRIDRRLRRHQGEKQCIQKPIHIGASVQCVRYYVVGELVFMLLQERRQVDR
jgi:hypothetical protein